MDPNFESPRPCDILKVIRDIDANYKAKNHLGHIIFT